MARRSPPLAHRQRGFTLMELVIVLVLMGVLGTWGASMIADSFRTTRIVDSTQTTAVQARYAVERLAREIREVNFINKASGYAITSTLTAGTSNLVFVRTIGGANTTVTVNRNGTDLSLAYSAPTAVTASLASQVSGFSLSFLKLDNTATTSAVDVRFVVISLSLADATSGKTITERVRVALRNT